MNGSHLIASEEKNGKKYMKVTFTLSEDTYEKLLMVSDEVGGANKAAIRAINDLYNEVFEVDTEVVSSEKETKGIKEVKKAVDRLEEKISGMGSSQRAPTFNSTKANKRQIDEVPELEEAEEARSTGEIERPELDEMLDNVVVNPSTEKENKEKENKEKERN